MDRLLTLRNVIMAIVSAIVVSILVAVGIVNAGSYNGDFTGYANGNLQGKSGQYVYQGHFANHKNNGNPQCSTAATDPASQWAWNSNITTGSPVTLYNNYGQAFSRSSFTLTDSGDTNCVKGRYWVDIYFGRYIIGGQACGCLKKVCAIAYDNSCQRAKVFFRANAPYTGP